MIDLTIAHKTSIILFILQFIVCAIFFVLAFKLIAEDYEKHKCLDGVNYFFIVLFYCVISPILAMLPIYLCAFILYRYAF